MQNLINTISGMSQSYSVSSSFGASYTSSSNGQGSGKAYRKESHSTPAGTSTRTTTQNLGELPVQETRHYDAQGRELLGGGERPNRPAIQQSQGRVEEVEDEAEADKAYREKMEDEYAKREGGA